MLRGESWWSNGKDDGIIFFLVIEPLLSIGGDFKAWPPQHFQPFDISITYKIQMFSKLMRHLESPFPCCISLAS